MPVTVEVPATQPMTSGPSPGNNAATDTDNLPPAPVPMLGKGPLALLALILVISGVLSLRVRYRTECKWGWNT